MTIEQVPFSEHIAFNPMSNSPDLKIASVSNLWVKMMHFNKAGDFIPGHAHTFDHISLLSTGSVEVLVEKESTIFTAPAIIYIKKELTHRITALESGTVVSCIHALRDGLGAGDIISEDMLPKGVNPHSVVTDYNLTSLIK